MITIVSGPTGRTPPAHGSTRGSARWLHLRQVAASLAAVVVAIGAMPALLAFADRATLLWLANAILDAVSR